MNINYAAVTANDIFHKRDQAIVFNTIHRILQKNYLSAIGNLNRTSEGVAIFVKKSYLSSPVNLRSNLEIVAATITLKKCKLLENHKYLSPNQHGFKKHRSTSDVSISLRTDVRYVLFNKLHLLIISIDIKKAYDTVWRHKVLSILQKI